VKRSRIAAAAAVLVVSTVALSGCYNGPDATTTTMASANTGNGVDQLQGNIQIDDATVVLGPEGSGSGTIVVRLVNVGAEPDALTYATINGLPADIIVADDSVSPGSPIELAPGTSTGFGYDSDNYLTVQSGLDVPMSSYVPIELGFREAGLAKMQVLTVPQAGYYEGVTGQP
jgi:hypothetical protein